VSGGGPRSCREWRNRYGTQVCGRPGCARCNPPLTELRAYLVASIFDPLREPPRLSGWTHTTPLTIEEAGLEAAVWQQRGTGRYVVCTVAPVAGEGP
jgi:hypothetical protein